MPVVVEKYYRVSTAQNAKKIYRLITTSQEKNVGKLPDQTLALVSEMPFLGVMGLYNVLILAS